MRIMKPDYYEEFACSAAACRYTCCQEWNIAVDEDTRKKWKTFKIPETVVGIDGFSAKTHLSDLTKRVQEGTIIDMGKTHICPFLNGDKLCNIVLAYGEECISRTCHTFPRKCQRYENHLEYALDVGCPEVLDMLWNKKAFSLEEGEVEELTGSKKELYEACEDMGQEEDLLFLIRQEAMKLIAREDIPLTKAWTMLFGLMLDFYEREELTSDYVQGMFSEKVLSQLKETVLKAQRDPIDHFTERNELFLDIAENYRRKELYAPVLKELTDRADWFELTEDDYTCRMCENFEDAWKILEPKLRLVMLENLYSGLLLPGGSLYSMVLKTEWMAIVLTCIRHALFLRWELDDFLTEEKAKDIIVVLQRMTGYSEADIEEYLENSFEEPVWSWGYLALIL
ncbi:MAG: flagellin lysine-N-methylase [Lachnospiraceae bacterium]|nr:flagellin lysine-N-methylase [Lachnospiraceae bacterium]